MRYLHPHHKILIAGAHGMVGSAICRSLRVHGYDNLLTPQRNEVDFIDQQHVKEYLNQHKPEVVVIAAAKVGGIFPNMTYPAEFIYNNLMIACNLIHQSHQAGVNRLLFLGSTCIYPRRAPQPIPEEALLTNSLEKTNEAYALAKISGIRMCQFYRQQYGCQYISAIPSNLYGPCDHYHSENAHVIPALIRRFHEAKEQTRPEVVIWGTGKVLREFLYVDDLAKGSLLLLEKYDASISVNIGSHEEVTIRELAEMIAKVTGYSGKIVNDPSKPDGMPRKKSDLTRIVSLGWQPKIPLREGLKLTYTDFLKTTFYASQKTYGTP